MKRLWSRRAAALRPYVPGEQPVEKLIKLNTNENPYPPSPEVEKAIRRVGDDLRLYPDPESRRLCAAIARRHGVSDEQVFVGNGSDEVLGLAFLAFFEGRGVVFPDITYSFYPVYAGLYGIEARTVPLEPDFTLRPDGMRGNGAGVVFANPNAPTSLCMPLGGVRRVLENNPDAAVIVDEAYIEFGGDSADRLLSEYDNLVVVRTLSKSHALAGLRAGYALAGADLIAALRAVKNSFNSYPLDALAQAGAEAAINDEAYYQQTRRSILQTRAALADRLRQLGFSLPEPCANFVFASHPEKSAQQLFAGLRRRGILVRHFDADRVRDYLRITVGTPEQTQALLQALSELVGEPA